MKSKGVSNTNRKAVVWFAALFVIAVLYRIFINPPANEDVRRKLTYIDRKLSEKGLRRWYIVTSGTRSQWYNKMLRTAKKSFHLKGMAIDIVVLDINGDWVFNAKDIDILCRLNREVEKEHPELMGAFGTYRTEGGIYRNMVHIDVRGHSLRYDWKTIIPHCKGP